MGFRDNWGSRITTILGFLCLLAAFSPNPATDARFAYVLTSFNMVAGSVAYRSARFRNLGFVPDSGVRQGVEIGSIVFMFLAIFAMRDSKEFIATQPTAFFSALWALVAYVVVVLRRPSAGKAIKAAHLTTIGELWSLKESGAITAEEYEQQKSRILR